MDKNEKKEIISIVIKIFLGFFGLLVLIMVLTYMLATPINAVTCNRFESNTGLSTKYDYFSGICYAEYDNIWLPVDQIYQLIEK